MLSSKQLKSTLILLIGLNYIHLKLSKQSTDISSTICGITSQGGFAYYYFD